MALTRLLPENNRRGQSLITGKQIVYSDVDLSFALKSGVETVSGDNKGDIFTKFDANAIKQALETLLLTNYNEKPFQPLFGGDLRRLLFENDQDIGDKKGLITRLITEAVGFWEPRALIEEVQVFVGSQTFANRATPLLATQPDKYVHDHSRDKNALSITVVFRITNEGELIELTVNMNRLR